MLKHLEIQFLRFSTGQPHDLASGMTFGLDLNCKSPSECEIAVEVMGPYLILIVSYKSRLRLSRRHQRIFFAAWTKGRMRCVSYLWNKPNGYSWSWQVRHVRDGTYFSAISFVSKDLIVLARKRDFSLEVCEIIEGDRHPTFNLRTLCVLKLPSLHPKTRVRLHTRNRTPFANHFSTPVLHSNRLPFRSSPADAVLGFEISLRRRTKTGAELRELAFWVHHSALRKYAAKTARPPRIIATGSPHRMRQLVSRLVDRISYAFTTPPVLRWLEWGPQSTRWRECSDDIRDRQTLAGMRCAMVHQGSLTLMDFSPGRLAMLRAQESPQNLGQKIMSTPTEIKAGRCFLRNFTSRLPYCECKKEEIKNRVLMDDEWILQIEVRFR